MQKCKRNYYLHRSVKWTVKTWLGDHNTQKKNTDQWETDHTKSFEIGHEIHYKN